MQPLRWNRSVRFCRRWRLDMPVSHVNNLSRRENVQSRYSSKQTFVARRLVVLHASKNHDYQCIPPSGGLRQLVALHLASTVCCGYMRPSNMIGPPLHIMKSLSLVLGLFTYMQNSWIASRKLLTSCCAHSTVVLFTAYASRRSFTYFGSRSCVVKWSSNDADVSYSNSKTRHFDGMCFIMKTITSDLLSVVRVRWTDCAVRRNHPRIINRSPPNYLRLMYGRILHNSVTQRRCRWNIVHLKPESLFRPLSSQR